MEAVMRTAEPHLKRSTSVQLRNILVATDFSNFSLNALKNAMALSAQFSSSLQIIHVITPENYVLLPPETAPGARDRLVQAARHEMETFAKRAMFTGETERTHIRFGEMIQTLNAFIREKDIDLVVVGTRGRTGISRFVLGSCAEYIVRGVEAPVLTINPEMEHPLSAQRPLRRVLACVSLAAESAPVAAYAGAIAQQTSAHLKVLHTLPIGLEQSPRADELTRLYAAELRSIVKLPKSCSAAEYVVQFGETSMQAVETARSWGADLIVLGAKPAELWTTHFGGTVYRVVVNADCPVVTVRERKLADETSNANSLKPGDQEC